ncbi:MAG: phosphatase PAP2 family protein [Actinomycetes bacterium]
MKPRGLWACGYGGVSLLGLAVFGMPDRPWILAWLLGAVFVAGWRSEQPIARTLFDWLPVLLILAAYDIIRLQAPSLIPQAHLQPQLGFDEFIGFGTAPTVHLQRALFRSSHPSVFDYVCLVVYTSHFVAALAVAVVLYVRARARFARYAFTFLACSLAGFATYVVYPAVPPWMASVRSALPPTVRIPDVLWRHLHVEILTKVFSGNPRYSNPVGAIPSEHAAYPLLFLLLFWAVASPRWRVVLVGYVAAMAFVLVYFAEHYVFDELMGFAYAVVAFVVVGRVIAAYAARSGRTEPTAVTDRDDQPAGSAGREREPITRRSDDR